MYDTMEISSVHPTLRPSQLSSVPRAGAAATTEQSSIGRELQFIVDVASGSMEIWVWDRDSGGLVRRIPLETLNAARRDAPGELLSIRV